MQLLINEICKKYNINKKRISFVGIFVLLLIGYAIFAYITGIYIPCPYYRILHIRCGGCGMAHMYISMLRFDFKSAMSYNPVLFWGQPVIYYIALKIVVLYVTGRNIRFNRIEKVICYFYVAILVIFMIIRNIPWVVSKSPIPLY